ncbi:MAG: hypothetical protein ABL974_20830 [Prosthecobacter sp.]
MMPIPSSTALDVSETLKACNVGSAKPTKPDSIEVSAALLMESRAMAEQTSQ